MTLLSISASFGALVWIFQEGNLAELLAFEPLGLHHRRQPDHHVQRASSGCRWTTRSCCCRGSRRPTGGPATTPRRVAEGLAKTAGVITGAALIMVTVFAAFALAEVDHHQEHRRRHGHRGPRRRDDHPGAARPGDDAADGPLELVGARVRSAGSPTGSGFSHVEDDADDAPPAIAQPAPSHRDMSGMDDRPDPTSPGWAPTAAAALPGDRGRPRLQLGVGPGRRRAGRRACPGSASSCWCSAGCC